MKTIFQKLRHRAGKPRPGARQEDLRHLESALGVILPGELTALYLEHNGSEERGDLPWRLLSATEAGEVNGDLTNESILPAEVRLFWADDEGNYSGCYFDGPHKGNVCFFDCEERDFSPRFASIGSFLEAMAVTANTEETPSLQMRGDLAGGGVDTGSEEKVKRLTQSFQNETDPRKRRQIAWDIIGAIPAEKAADLLLFLNDPDLHVQERAAETLGKHRFQPAIPLLEEVARRETAKVHNARIGAILSLGRMQSAAGLESLLAVSRAIPAGFHNYIYKALELHGCEAKFEGGKWVYRLPKAKDWRSLAG